MGGRLHPRLHRERPRWFTRSLFRKGSWKCAKGCKAIR